jgi:hypothetical protein
MVTAAAALIALTAILPAPANAGLIRSGGVKLALSTAGQSYEIFAVPGMETDRRFGLGAAVFLEWFDLPLLSVVTQVEYTQRGMSRDFNVTDTSGAVVGTMSIGNRLDYISVPIMGKLRIDLGGVTPYALAGVRFDYMLGYSSDQGAFNDLYDAFDRSIMGGAAGAGVELDGLLPVGVLAEVRYNFDLTDSYKTDLARVSNNSVDLWVGITF